jgi:hypothetical protein
MDDKSDGDDTVNSSKEITRSEGSSASSAQHPMDAKESSKEKPKPTGRGRGRVNQKKTVPVKPPDSVNLPPAPKVSPRTSPTKFINSTIPMNAVTESVNSVIDNNPETNAVIEPLITKDQMVPINKRSPAPVDPTTIEVFGKPLDRSVLIPISVQNVLANKRTGTAAKPEPTKSRIVNKVKPAPVIDIPPNRTQEKPLDKSLTSKSTVNKALEPPKLSNPESPKPKPEAKPSKPEPPNLEPPKPYELLPQDTDVNFDTVDTDIEVDNDFEPDIESEEDSDHQLSPYTKYGYRELEPTGDYNFPSDRYSPQVDRHHSTEEYHDYYNDRIWDSTATDTRQRPKSILNQSPTYSRYNAQRNEYASQRPLSPINTESQNRFYQGNYAYYQRPMNEYNNRPDQYTRSHERYTEQPQRPRAIQPHYPSPSKVQEFYETVTPIQEVPIPQYQRNECATSLGCQPPQIQDLFPLPTKIEATPEVAQPATIYGVTLEAPKVPDYSTMTPEEQAQKREWFRIMFGKLREFWPNYHIPDIPDTYTLEQIHAEYDVYVRNVYISQDVDKYKVYLVIMWLFIELALTKLGLDVTGYTKIQMGSMNKYERLLVELGEINYKTASTEQIIQNKWAPEWSILYMAIVNVVALILIKLLSQYIGAGMATNIIDTLVSYLSGTPAPNYNGNQIANQNQNSYSTQPMPDLNNNGLGGGLGAMLGNMDLPSLLANIGGMFMGNNNQNNNAARPPIINNNAPPSSSSSAKPRSYRPAYDE